MRELVAFLNWQRVHVGPKANGFTWATVAFEHTDYAGFADASFDKVAHFTQLSGDNIGCAVFLVAQFRVGVDVPAGVYPAFDFTWSHSVFHGLIQALRIAGFCACCNRCALV